VARVSTYLNFPGTAEAALERYRRLFGTDYARPTVRFADLPGPELPEPERQLVLHAELEIPGGHLLMATDMLASRGQSCRVGNNTTICLECDSRADVDRYFAELSEDGADQHAPSMMPWGQYWSTCLDRDGIRWMLTSD
jgi:PhnB protein